MFEPVGRLFGDTPETIMATAVASFVLVMVCLVIVALVIGTLQLIYIKRGIDTMKENNRRWAEDSERQNLAFQKLIEDGDKSWEEIQKRWEASDKRIEQQGLALQKLIEDSDKRWEESQKRWEASERRRKQQSLAFRKLVEDGEKNREESQKRREASNRRSER